MNVEQRIEVEKEVVRHLCNTMAKHGWAIQAVFDGEEIENPKTIEEALDVVFSVDEATINFRKQLGQGSSKTHLAYIVLGNDGWDCICDHSLSDPNLAGDDFEKIMTEEIDPFCDALEGA